MKEVYRGDIFYAQLGNEEEYEKKHIHIKGGIRPVLVIQNNIGNHFSPTVIVVPVTTAHKANRLPTHATYYHKQSYGTVLCEQILTIPKENLTNKIDKLTQFEMSKINEKLEISIGLEKK